MQPMRQHRQPWPIDKRRIHKAFKSLKVQLLYNYRNTRIPIVITVLATTFFLLYLSSSRDSDGDSLDESSSSFSLPRLSRDEIISEEIRLSVEHICKRRKLENNIEELRFCGDFSAQGGKKIVGLVEVRNVERSIIPFLSALGEVVDSIVIIDDHSSDESRLRILEHSSTYANGKPIVEVLLKKTGEWAREELFDRELLLTTARKVGGTHFILLDYDEYLSANCVENGLLRETILQLAPGESLNLPWIELWKSHTLQRVLPDDPNMNFLTRRQTVIFADDGTSHYTEESTTARLLGFHARNNTIHVLRCPRTICPQPLKYRGPDSELSLDTRVKRLPQCAIVEMRFLNLNNVLLKSAWYEALGRVTGADDGVTSGKMIKLLFPTRNSQAEEDYRLKAVDRKLLGKHAQIGAERFEEVETWRAEELLHWMDIRGKSAFADLHAVNLIDMDEVRNVLYQGRLGTADITYHVPRHKDGTLVVVYETDVGGLVRKFLTQIGFSEIQLGRVWDLYPEDFHHETFEQRELRNERWGNTVKSKILSTLQKSDNSRAFVVVPRYADSVCLAFLDVVRREIVHANAIILTTASGSIDEDKIWMNMKALAKEMGSHIQLISIPTENFGSYVAVHWLWNRLTVDVDMSNRTETDERSLLDFVETLHFETRLKRNNLDSPRYAPVGKLIFSLNFGRSGSKYLADLIGTTRGLVFSHHEPRCPNRGCSGGGALRMQKKPLNDSYEERKLLKLPMIRQAITDLARTNETSPSETRTVDCDAPSMLSDVDEPSGNSGRNGLRQRPVFETNSRSGCVVHILHDVVYAETNPNFKSWFYDVSLDFFPQAGYDVRVVVLRKYVAAVLKSLYETGYFTLRDGYNWMETLASVNAKLKVKSLQDDNQLDGYGKILSYVINSEALFRHVLRRYGHGSSAPQFLEMRSERLYSVEGTLEALEWLGLSPTESTAALAGSIRDKYFDGTSKKRQSAALVECEKRLSQFLENIKDGNEARHIRDLLRSLDKIESFEYPP